MDLRHRASDIFRSLRNESNQPNNGELLVPSFDSTRMSINWEGEADNLDLHSPSNQKNNRDLIRISMVKEGTTWSRYVE